MSPGWAAAEAGTGTARPARSPATHPGTRVGRPPAVRPTRPDLAPDVGRGAGRRPCPLDPPLPVVPARRDSFLRRRVRAGAGRAYSAQAGVDRARETRRGGWDRTGQGGAAWDREGQGATGRGWRDSCDSRPQIAATGRPPDPASGARV